MNSFHRPSFAGWAFPLIIFSTAIFADSLKLELVNGEVIAERLRAGAVAAADRQTTIEKLFQDAGCQTVGQRIDKHFANVICTLPGETSSTIIVGGHSDFVDAGKGIVDDWSGTSLLPSLYQTLKQQSRKHTYLFVAFAGEERGLLGSSKFVKSLSKEQQTGIQAFINLECLGLAPTKVWVHRSTPVLVQRLLQAANALRLPLAEVDVEQVGDDDTHPFLDKKIPVISIHSLTRETLPILHSRKDDLSAIRAEDYYRSYRLVAFYLALLDLKLAPEDASLPAVRSAN